MNSASIEMFAVLYFIRSNPIEDGVNGSSIAFETVLFAKVAFSSLIVIPM